ncbi:hypothetical protein FOZ63_034071 [Perkinsus olseni]|uniref:Uncharacterized protein n=1 Tax=Perkinsus olseni TaxID=32597 RepID=A0A7J6PTG0_PEROL|nr:hypothetical protein FOZ63_034071 [Perkinsus olseni]
MSATPNPRWKMSHENAAVRANRTSAGSVASEGEVRSVKSYRHRGSRHRPEVCYYPNSQEVLSEVDIKPFSLEGAVEPGGRSSFRQEPSAEATENSAGDGVFRYADDENESDVSNTWSVRGRSSANKRLNAYPPSPLSQVPLSPYIQGRAVSPLLRRMTPTAPSPSSAARAISPYQIRSASAAVTRQFSSPLPGATGLTPARSLSAAGALSPSSRVSQASPGRVVSRRIIRYTSPVPSRITTTTRYCRSASPLRKEVPSRSVPAESKRYALDLNTEEDVAFKSRTNTLLMTQPQEEPNASRLSWGACTRQALDDNRLEYPRVDPPESPAPLPCTVRASPRGSSPAAARRCVEDAVGAMGQPGEEGESIEMELNPLRPSRFKRSSEELLLLSDSDDSAASPPRKKRTSVDRQPKACRTPVATAGTQTENALTDCLPAEHRMGRLDYMTATPGRPDFASMMRHSCDCVAGSRSMLPGLTSPSYADRAQALKLKEAQLEKFLQESARRRARLMDSIRKRKREDESEDEVTAPIRGLELPTGTAEGRWARRSSVRERDYAGPRQWDARSAVSLPQKVDRWHAEAYSSWSKYKSIILAFRLAEPVSREEAEDRPPPVSPTTAHGVFVSEGKPSSRPRRRSSWHGDPNRTVFGDVTPLPLHGSYHRTVVPKANKLLGEGGTYAPIDDEQWKALAERLRQKSDVYAIVGDRSPSG